MKCSYYRPIQLTDAIFFFLRRTSALLLSEKLLERKNHVGWVISNLYLRNNALGYTSMEFPGTTKHEGECYTRLFALKNCTDKTKGLEYLNEMRHMPEHVPSTESGRLCSGEKRICGLDL